MTRERVLRRIDETMFSWAAELGQTSGEVANLGACQVVRSPIPFPAYNGVFCQSFDGDIEGRAREVRTKMQEMGVPPVWQVFCGASPSDLAERLIAIGAEKVVDLSCMWGAPGDLVQTPDVPGVLVRTCESEADVETYARLYPLLFDVPLDDWIETVVSAELALFRRPVDRFRRWLAFEGDKPIAAGAVFDHKGTAVLATLLTLPECRNRGIGAALMSRALQDLIGAGCTSMSVVAGPGADRLYARMGFKEVGRGAVLMWP